MERELNLCQRPGGDDARLWRRVAAALRCYRRTLQLDSRLHKLWLEFGNFCYMLNSHANRLLRQVRLSGCSRGAVVNLYSWWQVYPWSGCR